jgi:uncharacterized RDD family membrane protein YckC
MSATQPAYANPWRRLGAQLLDTLWMLPAYLLLGGLGLALQGGERLSPGAEPLLEVILALVVLQFWVQRQATPGKRLLGLRIVDAGHLGPPAFRQYLLRYIGYALSTLPLCLGFVWSLFDARRQCWHDKLAGTLVLRDPAPSPPSTVRFR